MKIYRLLICFSMIGGLRAETDQDYYGDTIDPNFYLEPRFEHEGHLWRPILMQHHPECPCLSSN